VRFPVSNTSVTLPTIFGLLSTVLDISISDSNIVRPATKLSDSSVVNSPAVSSTLLLIISSSPVKDVSTAGSTSTVMAFSTISGVGFCTLLSDVSTLAAGGEMAALSSFCSS